MRGGGPLNPYEFAHVDYQGRDAFDFGNHEKLFAQTVIALAYDRSNINQQTIFLTGHVSSDGGDAEIFRSSNSSAGWFGSSNAFDFFNGAVFSVGHRQWDGSDSDLMSAAYSFEEGDVDLDQYWEYFLFNNLDNDRVVQDQAPRYGNSFMRWDEPLTTDPSIIYELDSASSAVTITPSTNEVFEGDFVTFEIGGLEPDAQFVINASGLSGDEYGFWGRLDYKKAYADSEGNYTVSIQPNRDAIIEPTQFLTLSIEDAESTVAVLDKTAKIEVTPSKTQ